MLINISRMLILVAFVFLSVGVAEPALAIVPEVRNVVAFNVGSDTVLNVTVYHWPEDVDVFHHVDVIRVTIGENTTDLDVGAHPYSPGDVFVVQYFVGPVSGNPAVMVQAHCIVNGWSAVNWTGVIPEFSPLGLLLTLALATSFVPFVFRKARSTFHK